MTIPLNVNIVVVTLDGKVEFNPVVPYLECKFLAYSLNEKTLWKVAFPGNFVTSKNNVEYLINQFIRIEPNFSWQKEGF